MACVFLGYCSTTKAYRCYDPVKHRIYVSRHVKFVESCFPFQALTSCSPNSTTQVASHSFPITLTSFDDLVVKVPVPYIPSVSSSSTLPSSHTVSSSTSDSPATEHCSSTSVSVPLPSVHPMTTRSKAGIFKSKHPISLLTTTVPSEPRNFHEAVKHDVATGHG